VNFNQLLNISCAEFTESSVYTLNTNLSHCFHSFHGIISIQLNTPSVIGWYFTIIEGDSHKTIPFMSTIFTCIRLSQDTNSCADILNHQFIFVYQLFTILSFKYTTTGEFFNVSQLHITERYGLVSVDQFVG
jgi:hypothetical protein